MIDGALVLIIAEHSFPSAGGGWADRAGLGWAGRRRRRRTGILDGGVIPVYRHVILQKN